MKKCPKCNAEIAWGLEVCPSCGKKVKNQRVELHLKNASGQECTVSCSEKIKMSLLQLYVELRFGIPALNVKPANGKDIVITLALFFSIFIFPAIFQNGFGIFLCLAMVVVNLIYTKDFYYNAIKKKLSEGYTPADEDTAAILNNAGLGNSVATATAGTSASNANTATKTSTSTTNISNATSDGSSFSEKASALAENIKAASANGGFKKFLTKRNIIIAVIAIVVLIILINMGGNSNNINMVKNGYFYFNQEDTVGELVEAGFDDVKWESITGTDGKSYVNMTGSVEGIEVLIQFRVNEDKGTFVINACEVEGIPVSVDELF